MKTLFAAPLCALLCASWLAVAPALAAQQYPDAGPNAVAGQGAIGSAVIETLNGSNQAVPVGAANPVPVSANQGTQGSPSSPWWFDTPPGSDLTTLLTNPIAGQLSQGVDIGGIELLYWGSAALAAGTGWGTPPASGAIVGNVNAILPASPVGGALISSEIAPNNTTAVVVKGTAGTIYAAQVYGIASSPAYLKIYNAVSATCGSGTPVLRWMIPAAATAANGTGSNVPIPAQGIALGTGITYCVTTGIADADTTAPAASTFLINIEYD